MSSNNIPSNEQPGRKNRSITQSSLQNPGALRALFERTVLTWRLFWDGRVGIAPKLIPIGALIYLISPVDIVPELLVGPLGVLDDVGILLLALNLFIQVSPPDIVKEHLRELGSRSANHTDEGDEDVVDGTATPLDE